MADETDEDEAPDTIVLERREADTTTATGEPPLTERERVAYGIFGAAVFFAMTILFVLVFILSHTGGK